MAIGGGSHNRDYLSEYESQRSELLHIKFNKGDLGF
jgi:hypothetical protein